MFSSIFGQVFFPALFTLIVAVAIYFLQEKSHYRATWTFFAGWVVVGLAAALYIHERLNRTATLVQSDHLKGPPTPPPPANALNPPKVTFGSISQSAIDSSNSNFVSAGDINVGDVKTPAAKKAKKKKKD